MEEKLTIGRVAQAAGVNVETIRYYQRRGLLDEPDKPLGGYRRYAVALPVVGDLVGCLARCYAEHGSRLQHNVG